MHRQHVKHSNHLRTPTNQNTASFGVFPVFVVALSRTSQDKMSGTTLRTWQADNPKGLQLDVVAAQGQSRYAVGILGSSHREVSAAQQQEPKTKALAAAVDTTPVSATTTEEASVKSKTTTQTKVKTATAPSAKQVSRPSKRYL